VRGEKKESRSYLRKTRSSRGQGEKGSEADLSIRARKEGEEVKKGKAHNFLLLGTDRKKIYWRSREERRYAGEERKGIFFVLGQLLHAIARTSVGAEERRRRKGKRGAAPTEKIRWGPAGGLSKKQKNITLHIAKRPKQARTKRKSLGKRSSTLHGERKAMDRGGVLFGGGGGGGGV